MNQPARLLFVLITWTAFPASAGEPSKEHAQFFEKQVRPILTERCYGCHSTVRQKSKGGLVVDSLAGLLQGGETGPAIVPGEPEKSLLIEAIRYASDTIRMPPKVKLPDTEIAILTQWVQLGAPWPNVGALKASRVPGKITEEDRQWWAFQPIKPVAPPDLLDPQAAIHNDIERFIRAKLIEKNLSPAPEAERRVLIRRLTLDLTGLPPTPEEVDAFVSDPAPDAYERLVERLLASPHYGERSARLWLDLVRYADSDGYRIDQYRPQAWRYRDYVVRSFNADKPYDRFVREQLAGDELYPGDPEATIATGYLRHWIYEYNQRDVRTQWNLILDDLTDTTSDVFLGLGMQCARCHDHKFDPILQKDYYRLRGFFASLLPREDLVTATAEERRAYEEKQAAWNVQTAEIRAQIDALEAPYRDKAQEAAIIKFPDDIQAMMRKPAKERTPFEHQIAELAYRQVTYEFEKLDGAFKDADKDQVFALRRELAKFDGEKPAPLPTPPVAVDVGPIAPPITIPKKGDTPIEPGPLTLLDENPAVVQPLPNSTGRRAALATWLTDPSNPLTARVMVNRLWQQHFGQGLAANASDFGRLGSLPSHPELLDWLARELVTPSAAGVSPWSLKHIHRLIACSATYRQSANHSDPQAAQLADPENRLLWRGNVRRLDAEQIRDSLLAVTGKLDLQAGGPGVQATDPRRTLYTRIMRNTRDPLLDAFDAPYWFTSASSRDTTTTPVQSLLMFNSKSLLLRAREFAERVLREEPDEVRRISRAYRLAFGRDPTAEEQSSVRQFLAEQIPHVDQKRSGSAAAEFIGGKVPYRDGQAADIPFGKHAGFQIPHQATFPSGDFTIEAYLFPRTIAETGAIRTIAAKWGDRPHAIGWALGVTGKQSRRKPQTAVLQMYGKKLDGTVGEEVIFSDQHIALSKPYYLAAALTLAKDNQPGEVTFYLKDLSNDDEPLLISKVEQRIVSGLENSAPLTLGSRGVRGEAGFDGLLDDIRLSESALGVDQLLFTREGVNDHTIGYWQFETKPNVIGDTSGHGYDIRPVKVPDELLSDPHKAVWVDLCHVLLNSSELLYVE